MKTYRKSDGIRAAAVVSIALILAVGAARGDSGAECPTPVLTLAESAQLLRIEPSEMERLARKGEVPGRWVGASWRVNCVSLVAWLDGKWGRAGTRLEQDEMASVSAAGAAREAGEAAPAPNEPAPFVAEEATPIGEAPEPTAEEVLLRDQRVMLAPRQIVIDFGQYYAQIDREVLAPVDGGAALAAIEQETLLTTLQARVGFRNEMELFVGATHMSQDSDTFVGSEKIASAGISELGNVNVGLRRTLMKERAGRPSLIGTLVAGIRTDNTPYTMGGALALVKSIDPAVLFASVNYTHTDDQRSAAMTLRVPKDRIDVAFGYALAVNDTLALSMSVSAALTGATRFQDAQLRRQDSYSLRFGLTSWLARGIYIEPSVGFTLGGPGDGFVLGVTVPYTLGRR